MSFNIKSGVEKRQLKEIELLKKAGTNLKEKKYVIVYLIFSHVFYIFFIIIIVIRINNYYSLQQK